MKRMFLVFLLLLLVGAVVGGGTSSMTLAQADQRAGLATISGKVKDVKGVGVKGATVTVEGQSERQPRLQTGHSN